MKWWVGVVFLCVGGGAGVAMGQARLGPYVVDSNGLKVGHLTGGNDILMFIDGNPTLVGGGPGGLGPTGFALYFTDAACGTQALMVSDGTSGQFFSTGFYTTDNVIHYVNTASATIAGMSSYITVNPDGSLGACLPTITSLIAAPALSGSIPAFTPPFSLVDALPVSPAPATATFNDVPTTHPFFQFIEALYASGITAGCQAAPPLYCPDNPVTRGQMAVFLAKALGL